MRFRNVFPDNLQSTLIATPFIETGVGIGRIPNTFLMKGFRWNTFDDLQPIFSLLRRLFILALFICDKQRYKLIMSSAFSSFFSLSTINIVRTFFLLKPKPVLTFTLNTVKGSIILVLFTTFDEFLAVATSSYLFPIFFSNQHQIFAAFCYFLSWLAPAHYFVFDLAAIHLFHFLLRGLRNHFDRKMLEMAVVVF